MGGELLDNSGSKDRHVSGSESDWLLSACRSPVVGFLMLTVQDGSRGAVLTQGLTTEIMADKPEHAENES